MKKMFKPAFTVLFLIGAISCQKEKVYESVTGKNGNGSPLQTQRGGDAGEVITKTYHYQDATYPVTATITHDADGKPIADPVKNDVFYAVKEILEGIEDPGMWFYGVNDIYIYEGQTELEACLAEVYRIDLENKEKDLNVSWYTCQPWYRLYRHVGFNDMLFEALNGSGNLGGLGEGLPYDHPWIGSGSNDQVSSLRIHGGTFISQPHLQVVTLFKHINMGGENITFESNGCAELQVPNLCDFWIWQFLFFGENWNDETSSFSAKFYIN